MVSIAPIVAPYSFSLTNSDINGGVDAVIHETPIANIIMNAKRAK